MTTALKAALVSLLLLGRGTTNAHADPHADSPGVVNVNEAKSEQLQLLPRVGPATARRIIAHRRKRPFRRIRQLRRVRGIGRKTFRRLRPYVTIKGPTTLTRKIRRSP